MAGSVPPGWKTWLVAGYAIIAFVVGVADLKVGHYTGAGFCFLVSFIAFATIAKSK